MSHFLRLVCLLLAFVVFATSLTHAADAPAPTQQVETKEHRDARMAWWRAAKFGMFIHWGVYSVPAGFYQGKSVPGIGEWIMNKGKIPTAEYQKFPAQFNPVKFNAEQWVQAAEDAGVKYIVITAKHHDGFAMYKSAVSPFNIYDDTPFKRDPLLELAAACRKHGIKLGFYYSQAQDWNHPGGASIGGHWDKAQDGDMDEYLKTIAVPQVKELLTNYGQDVPAVLWWDTPRDMTPARAELFQPLLATRPDLITNNRLGGGYKGDTETPEQHIPPKGFPGEDWETCMTINNTWGYKSDDTNWKSTETLLRNLIDIASHGGNYLLNVGPTSEGIIPQPEVDRLKAVGDWLKVNGESIYGSNPTCFGDEAGHESATEKDKNGKPKFNTEWKWRCTTKAGKIYIHIFEWPKDGSFVLSKVPGTITKAYMLADAAHTVLKVTTKGDATTIALPAKATDSIASVLCLETK